MSSTVVVVLMCTQVRAIKVVFQLALLEFNDQAVGFVCIFR